MKEKLEVVIEQILKKMEKELSNYELQRMASTLESLIVSYQRLTAK